VVGVCGIESGRCNQRWGVDILSNDMTSKTSAESSHFGPTMVSHVNSRKPKFKTSLERLFGGCGVDHTIYVYPTRSEIVVL
jgi:hypothetical protein